MKLHLFLLLPFFSLFYLSFFLLLTTDRKLNEIPSALLGKNVPEFKAKSLFDSELFDSSNEFNNETVIVNFFATWCKPCIDEHIFLKKLSNEKKIKIYGINYKDDPEKAIIWLQKLGNPYKKVLIDHNASIGIDWGVYGIPETFIVSNSVIKYRLIGPITEKNYKDFYLKIMEN